MSEKPPFYYPGNKYMDEKWSLIQEAILSISEGNYNLQLPENLGDDHLDSILVALKMMAETLEDREKMLKALGAFKWLHTPLIVLGLDLRIVDYNAQAQTLFKQQVEKGKSITSLINHEHLLKPLQEIGVGMSTQLSLDAMLEDGNSYDVKLTLVNPGEPIDFEGAILQFVRKLA